MARPRIPKNKDLPKYFYLRKGRLVYQPPGSNEVSVRINGKLVRSWDDYVNKKSALEGFDRRKARWVTKLLKQSRKRAKVRGVEFSLSREDLEGLFRESCGECSLTGIEFDFARGNYRRRPWVPSIDRIDSNKGYTPENCRLVCSAANLAMNEWGEDVLHRMAYGYVGCFSQNKKYAA